MVRSQLPCQCARSPIAGRGPRRRATTSVPEAIGTPRTWAYRYRWLRDAAFAVEALRRLLHLDEGEELIGFLRDVAEAGPRRPLDGVGGARELAELVLDHLTGFGGSGPVQIGTRLDVRDGRVRTWI